VSVLALVCAGGAWAQAVAGFGSVTGTVLENTVDGVPDAQVVVSNATLGVRWTMLTSDDGVFFAPALVPAPGYRIKVTRASFADWESSEFEVFLGRTLNFKVDLVKGEGSATRPGKTALKGGGTAPQTATPAPQAEAAAPQTDAAAPQASPATTKVPAGTVLPLVDDSKSGVNTLITQAQIEGLPASDRRLDTFALLAPAVNTATTGQVAFLNQAVSNSFVLDGLDITNDYYGERAGIANQISQSAVSEMQVFSADAPAEFGRYMGGVVNAATKSGGNGYHGSAEGYLRIASMTSGNRFAPGRDLLHGLNQEAATLGGPVQSNKIFFFVNAEQLSAHFDGLNRITNPLIVDPTGTTVLASACKATAAQCAAATQFIQSQMNVLVPFSYRWLTGLARIDYRRSDRNSFSVEGNVMNAKTPDSARIDNVAPNGGLLGLNNSTEQTRFARVGWTSAPLPSWNNDLRVGYYEDRWTDPASQDQMSTGDLGISLAGTTIGATHPYSSLVSEHRYQLVDNLTLTSASHTIRVGGDLSIRRDATDALANSAGTYYYNSLTAFAQDFGGTGLGTGLKDYTLFTQQLGNPSRSLRIREYNVYAQDTWKISTGFTVTGGVRWDRPKLPQPTSTNAAYYETGTINTPYNDFSPRVAAAYMIDDRTVLRVGYGYFFMPYPGQFVDALFLGNGIYQTNIVVNPAQTGAVAFPKVFATTTGLPVGLTNLMYASSKLRNPHTQQTSVSIERRLDRSTTLTLSAIDSRGFKLWTAADLNLSGFSKTGTYVIDDASGQQVGTYLADIYTAKNDPNYAHIFQVQNGGSSWYYAGALELRKQMSQGLTLRATYTFSHSISDVNGPLMAGGIAQNLYDNDSVQDRGNSLTDQRQRGVVNWVWQPRLTGSSSPAARFIANGWQLSGIATLASGEPVTQLALPIGQQFSTAAMVYPSSLNGYGGWSRLLFNGISTLKTQPQYGLDMRVSRTLPFTERIKGTVMFEAFNVLNHQFATTLNTIGYTGVTSLPPGAVSGPLSGVLKPVIGLGEGIGAQGYPDGTSARRVQVAFRVVF